MSARASAWLYALAATAWFVAYADNRRPIEAIVACAYAATSAGWLAAHRRERVEDLPRAEARRV